MHPQHFPPQHPQHSQPPPPHPQQKLHEAIQMQVNQLEKQLRGEMGVDKMDVEEVEKSIINTGKECTLDVNEQNKFVAILKALGGRKEDIKVCCLFVVV